MKKTVRHLPLALLLAACGGGISYTVEVQNLSAKSFDSVHVFINTSTSKKPTAAFVALRPSDTAPPLAVGEIFGGSNNTKPTATAIFYAADTVIKSDMPQNGEKVPNGHYKAIIDSGLQVKWMQHD